MQSKQGLIDGWEEDTDGILLYPGFSYIPEVIYIEFISQHYDNLLVGYFGIEKT